MASVHSPIRKMVKPFLYKLFGPKAYHWMQYRAKLRDIQYRLVEEAEISLLPKILSKESVSIDIGANYAYYTVRLADLCPTGKVYAFEPIPSTFDILKRIVQHYAFTNVELFDKGVGAKNETLEFEVPLQELGTHSAGQAHLKGRDNSQKGREKYHNFDKHESFSCEVVSLDSFLPKLTRLDFVKIDIEGAELFALQGMRKLLAQHKPIVLIEICPFFLRGFKLEEADLRNFITEIGYEIFRYENEQLVPYSAAEFADSNYILLHKEKSASLSVGSKQ